MKVPHVSRNTRFILMMVSVVSLAAFATLGAGWATPARPDGCIGTVPCGGGGTGGGNSNGNSSSSNSSTPGAIGSCGAGAQTFTVTGANNVTTLLDVSIGSVKLLSNQAGVGKGAIRPLFVPISSLTVDLIPATLLKTSPGGWTDLSCGIMVSGKVADGQAATYILKGQQVCFNLPVGAAAAYKTMRVAYYDTGLGRWVFLQTNVSATQACHSSFRLAPSTFALFGSA